MENVDVELPARISATGIIAGILVGLALAATMMALGTAVGITAFPGSSMPRHAGIGFAGWLLLSLVVGSFAGGWLAAGAARVLRRRDGVLHGLVTWAAIALVSMSLVGNVMRGAAVALIGDGALGPGAGGSMQTQHRGAEIGAWGAFAALLLPMLAGLVGGVVGALRERRAAGIGGARRRRPIVVSPRHTADAPSRPPLPQP